MARFGSLDGSLFLWINTSIRHPILDRLMWAASRGVHHGEVWILAVLLGMIIDPPARRRALLDVLLALALATLTVNFGLKRIARRPRPFLSLEKAMVTGRRPSDWSFPSGHTAAAFAGAWLLSSHYPALSPLFYAYAILVGWSRIYIGVHYPSDVVIGAGCGIGLALVFHSLVATLMDLIL
jgi:undecaprenyl-diphosphatase